MFDKLQDSGKTGAKGENKKANSLRNVAVGLTTVATLATGVNSAEAVEQKPHHIRTNSEEGRKAGFMRVPQNEQELADFIAEAKKEHDGIVLETEIIAYKALYETQNNKPDKIHQTLTEYYKILAAHSEIRPYDELGEECIKILIEDGHFETAKEMLKDVPDQKERVRLATKIGLAEHDAKNKKGH